MTKKRTSSETEYLRGIIRELKSEIRHLKKTTESNKKRINGYDQLISAEQDVLDEVFNLPKQKCPECNEVLDILKLSIKEVHICTADNCNYRKTFNKKKHGQ